MNTLAEEIRADFDKIKARYLGLPDAIGSIRVSTIEKVETHIAALEDRVAACTCEPVQAHQVDPRNRPIDFDFQMRRLKRLAAEDAGNGFGTVFQTVSAHQAAGRRAA